MSTGTTARLATAIVAAGAILVMHAAPAATPTTPTTPAQQLPAQKSKVPPLVKYVAQLGAAMSPATSRLGGWRCSGLTCTLLTSGPMTQARLRELCRSLMLLAKEQRVRFPLYKFTAEEGATRRELVLDKAGFTWCTQGS
jgi:hypothetical protein